MKKIFFMAVSAVLLAAGCQKTEIQNEMLPQIGFKTQMGKLTKAENPDAKNSGRYDNLNAQGFKAWGFFATDGDLNYELGELYLAKEDAPADATIGEKGIDVTPGTELDTDGSAKSWTTDDIYYWPGQNKSLEIYAVSLDETENNTYANVVPSYEAKTVTVSNFIVDAKADNDLMVAEMIIQDQDDNEFVKPQFQHALTKVLVTFKKSKDTDNVYLISATTNPIVSKGSLVVSNPFNVSTDTPSAQDETDPTDPDATDPDATDPDATDPDATDPDDPFKWTNSTVEGDKIPYKAENFETAIIEGVVGYDASNSKTQFNACALTTSSTIYGSWLLLPQEDILGYYLDVEYIVDKTYMLQRFDLCIENKIGAWSRNQQTTYNIIISPDDIRFSADVKDWVDVPNYPVGRDN